jgi:hypothetical protein
MRTHNKAYVGAPHTYYVSAAGNDANTGASADLPLLTLAAVNALVLRPGDRVLFNRGDTWVNQVLTMGYSGNPSRHIKFGAYGTGANPIIDGSLTLTTWASDSGAIYKKTSFTQVLYNSRALFEDGVRLIKAVSKVAMVAGSWFLDDAADTIYLWCTADADPATKTIKFTNQQDCIHLEGKSYIEFDNIDVTMSYLCGYNFRDTGSSHVYVWNATATWVTQRGFDAGGLSKIGGGGYRVTWRDHIYFTTCVAHDCIGEGFFLSMGDVGGFTSCTSYHNGLDLSSKGYTAIVDAGPGFTITGDSSDFFMRNCTAYDCPNGSAVLSIEWVVAETEQQTTRVVIDSCNVYRTGSSNYPLLVDEGLNSSITNNLFHASSGTSFLVKVGNSAAAPSTSSNYYHNTFYTNVNSAQQHINVFYGSNLTFENNIFAYGGTGGYAFVVTTNATSGFVSNYNFMGAQGPGKWVSSWYSIAQWRTNTGQDTETLTNADAVFVTPGTDFHLQTTSPCKGAGVNGLPVLIDYDQVVRGTPPDIGAYEYV